jgi:hypothetical protein
MISLRKNDKIIIIVAVIILVIAGVGVAMYQSPKTTSILPPAITGGSSYEVIYAVRNGSLDPISDFAGKKAPFGTSVMIPEGNIQSVTFNMSWTDDHLTFLKRRGMDSLTLEVTMPDGFSTKDTNMSAPITGAASISMTILSEIYPPEGSIKAKDVKEAQALLQQQPYYQDTWTDKEINISVSVNIGEIRLLKQLQDKGNNFEIKITYQYLEGSLKEDTTNTTGGDVDTPPEDDPWVEQEIPPYLSMIINTGCGRYV